MSLPVSRRSFLSLATSGLTLGAVGLTPATEAARRKAAGAEAMPGVMPATGTVYLNLNECPLGPAPAALEAVRAILPRAGRYLLELPNRLVAAFADQEQLPSDHVAVYPGSSEALARAARAFTSVRASVVMPDPTFEEVANVAAAQGAPVRRVPLRADGAHDVKAMASADPNAGLIYLCNPNNPTGSITPRADIEWLLRNKPASSVLLVDEAYLHYSEQPSVIDLIDQRQDLLVLRTFSKLYGMAGLRLGLAAASPGLLGKLAGFGHNPVAITAAAAGIACLGDRQLVPMRRAENARIRDATIVWLQNKGYACLPSQANCFMVDVKHDGKAFAAAMAKQEVIVGRIWPSWPRRVRVTVGTEAEMLRFREAFMQARK
ncbi:pyridoxal phosphate-dependent aminotransferase [Xanthomonas albilineans]|uniref:pyridoxal phosphate-dependent aminotransferase n=1 Tax=Xanthomonas albilineans TaxID=29447 RepID=UPI0005F32405|nr:pyridoxal phosphate-dependent aminotransferase [Xanthomonas albilineans]PPU94622.1 pyridoxal phosphate-dependent aminotransferase [Xanthomonas albilineans]